MNNTLLNGDKNAYIIYLDEASTQRGTLIIGYKSYPFYTTSSKKKRFNRLYKTDAFLKVLLRIYDAML